MILQKIILQYETKWINSIKQSYSIMRRAKQRAEKNQFEEEYIQEKRNRQQYQNKSNHQYNSHSFEKRYNKERVVENNNNDNRWAAMPLLTKTHNNESTIPNQSKFTKEIMATDYFKRINETKAASINERLIKPIKSVEQPIDPHLLKVSIIGPPNAGKSTLVNKLVGEDITIVSSKLHTTRERILAILSQDNYQVIFLDTPGIISPQSKEKMNRSVTTSSWRSLDEADYVLIVIDGNRTSNSLSKQLHEYMIDRLSALNIPATLIFNKMDITTTDNKKELEEVANEFKKEYPNLQNVLYISALEEDGLDDIKKILFDSSKPNLWLYPKDLKLEMSDLKRVEELIRVQFFKRLHQYLPYMLKQENVGWTELKNGTLRIEQNVYVERDSQHKIVVGANGMIINRVIEDARHDISKAFKRPIQLFIQVKTRKK
ncbi:unnamed protein product [Cunninghamella echinulata]